MIMITYHFSHMQESAKTSQSLSDTPSYFSARFNTGLQYNQKSKGKIGEREEEAETFVHF